MLLGIGLGDWEEEETDGPDGWSQGTSQGLFRNTGSPLDVLTWFLSQGIKDTDIGRLKESFKGETEVTQN